MAETTEDTGIDPKRYAARYGDDDVITEEFMADVLEGIGRHYLEKQSPPLSFQAVKLFAYAASGKQRLSLLEERNAWHACCRLRDMRGLLAWDHVDAPHRMITIRLTRAGMDALGIRQEGRLARYVRAEA